MTRKEAGLKVGLESLLASSISKLKVVSGYLIDKDITSDDLHLIAGRLFADPVVESFSIEQLPWEGYSFVVTTGYKPGVTDNIGHTASIATRDLVPALQHEHDDFVHAFKVHVFWMGGDTIPDKLAAQLHNPIVEFAHVSKTGVVLPDYNISRAIKDRPLFQVIPVRDASDEQLIELSKNGLLALNLEEMKAIQSHYVALGREPTDIELETFAQTWSEHCVHKTLKGSVNLEITGADGSKSSQHYDNLIKETIFAATNHVIENSGDENICVSVFKDNAGIITFSKDHNACFKVETHNHPSAKEPYGGAATGIGGVIRDVLAAGMGAKPVANSDVFCFADPRYPEEKVPEGVIHPRKILAGVVAGVRDYGNPMGIPTVNGSLYFDNRYLGNPLVFCGTAGIIPTNIQGKPSHEKAPRIGDFLVFVGGKTGRDGIHGVTFASLEMDKHTTSNPVQIGDPITERMFMEAMFKARDAGLYTFVQDCGGGGLSSAFGEMAEGLGAVIDLDAVPLKYQGLLPWEIWISESQERQAFSVPPEHFDAFKAIFDREDVGVYKVGKITGDKRLVLRHGGTVIGDIDVDFLHGGVPKARNDATWHQASRVVKPFTQPGDLTRVLVDVLSCLNVCSKEWVVRQYDSEVQGNTVLKPLQGKRDDGPGDGAIVKPLHDSYEGLVLTNGMNPKYGDLDPYWMAASGIDEAIRNVVCCGGNPRHVALLDNFCWGNPRDPVQMGRLVRACQACKDMSIGFNAPFISGKDSLNNEYKTDGGVISIPATLLISAIGKIDDVRRSTTMFFKKPGNLVYVVGETASELGGSHYLDLINEVASNTVVPSVEPAVFARRYTTVHQAIKDGIVLSAHDCSEGGLAVAIAEMCIASDLGATIDLTPVPTRDGCDRDDLFLFSESNGRLVVEIEPSSRDAFERMMSGVSTGCIGRVTAERILAIHGLAGQPAVHATVDALRRAWITPLDLDANAMNKHARG